MQKCRRKSPAKRARLDNVPWSKPEIEVTKKPFINIPSPVNGYSRDYFHGMIEVLNEMSQKFPNARNGDVTHFVYRPASSHLHWAFKTAALIAYHLATGKENKPLSHTVVDFGNTEKWEYDVENENLAEDMKATFERFFNYGKEGIFKKVKTDIKDPDTHFANSKALGQFLTNWQKKADNGGNYYVSKSEVTEKPSKAVLTEHYLFFDACGMWDPCIED